MVLPKLVQSRTENPFQQFQLQVGSDLKDLDSVLQWFEAVAQTLLSETPFWQCQLAVAEGFTNAVLHAHKNLTTDTPVTIEMRVFSQHVEIEICDCGQPFDLLAELSSIAKKHPDPLRDSHRGLALMREVMDEINYLRLENQLNCLLMKKNLGTQSSAINAVQ